MITEREAEVLAKKLVSEYLNACKLDTQEQAADPLMKLASVCGVMMCATVGQKEAVARLEGTAAFIARPENAGPWTKATVN